MLLFIYALFYPDSCIFKARTLTGVCHHIITYVTDVLISHEKYVAVYHASALFAELLTAARIGNSAVYCAAMLISGLCLF